MSRGARWLLGVALIFWILIGAGIWWLWPVIGQLADPNRTPRTFYIPTESMMPTLVVNDRIRPMLIRPDRLRRGMVIVFQARDSVRVDRIVGIAGDAVYLRGGHVWVNGQVAVLRQLGPGPRLNDGEGTRMAAERLPGEPGTHRILDAGPSPGDDFGPVRVPAEALFVLGDDRDRAADSRYPVEAMGVGFVPRYAVLGRVDRLLWRRGLRDLGRPVDGIAP